VEERRSTEDPGHEETWKQEVLARTASRLTFARKAAAGRPAEKREDAGGKEAEAADSSVGRRQRFAISAI